MSWSPTHRPQARRQRPADLRCLALLAALAAPAGLANCTFDEAKVDGVVALDKADCFAEVCVFFPDDTDEESYSCDIGRRARYDFSEGCVSTDCDDPGFSFDPAEDLIGCCSRSYHEGCCSTLSEDPNGLATRTFGVNEGRLTGRIDLFDTLGSGEAIALVQAVQLSGEPESCVDYSFFVEP